MVSDAQFKKAVQIINDLPKSGGIRPTQDQQLQLYSSHQQATEGDNHTHRPGLLDFVGKAKWDAWKSLEGTSKEDAQKKYLELVQELLGRDDSQEAKRLWAELKAVNW